MLVITQNLARMKQATGDNFKCISFSTNDNKIASPVVGKASSLSKDGEEEEGRGVRCVHSEVPAGKSFCLEMQNTLVLRLTLV